MTRDLYTGVTARIEIFYFTCECYWNVSLKKKEVLIVKASEAFLVHGEMVEIKNPKTKAVEQDAYVGFVKSVVEDKPSEMVIIPNPEITVYVTKPQFRQNTIKKECIKKTDCDAYRTQVKNITQTLFNAINNPGRFRPVYGFINPKKMLSSPYVYGADIDYGVHLKYAYNKANGGKSPSKYRVGALDIETDVNGTKQIILITYMNWDGQTYVGVLKEFFRDHTVDEAMALWKKTEREFRDKLTKKIQSQYDKSNPIDVHLQIFDKEVDLIKWVFDRIHECKPDFCGIWNIAYDIPYILDRLEFRGVDPCDVFCSPDVPVQWRKCNFHLDKGKKGDHITDRWSWLHLTDYTCYIDSMALYGRLRKAKGRESSYKLNDIGTKEIGAGKLEFGDGEGHSTMQLNHPVEYTVYNIVDVLILHVMEEKNNDMFNMVMLSDVSMLDEFHHQSVQLKNSFYAYLDEIGMVPCSVGDQLTQPWDQWLHNQGGAVLDPDRALGITVPCLQESEDVGRAARFIADIDVTSMYPSALIAFNVTRETKLATVLNIDNTQRAGKVIDVEQVRLDPKDVPGLKNIEVEHFFKNAIYAEANCMYAAQMFNLPSYDGIDRYMSEHHPELCATV